jgi:hypothetical protein
MPLVGRAAPRCVLLRRARPFFPLRKVYNQGLCQFRLLIADPWVQFSLDLQQVAENSAISR